jgi:hypothetical protein
MTVKKVGDIVRDPERTSPAVRLSEAIEPAPPITEETLAELEASGAYPDVIELVRKTLGAS